MLDARTLRLPDLSRILRSTTKWRICPASRRYDRLSPWCRLSGTAIRCAVRTAWFGWMVSGSRRSDSGHSVSAPGDQSAIQQRLARAITGSASDIV